MKTPKKSPEKKRPTLVKNLAPRSDVKGGTTVMKSYNSTANPIVSNIKN